ncbi:FkbM family methyltransferase [Chitinophaga lutea]|uniref:FkbM family methyltransferase n=1 Tax=Chitinophaga lutea TaxID=2488634 RepID=A0A3N4PK36_9BACT|nr:FkbM family methyltransferase [Chitinophaga lutea]RPE08576.1 FkbM family methyltransferase [Chitinophaga lutea]
MPLSSSFIGNLTRGILKNLKPSSGKGRALSYWTVKYLKHLPQEKLSCIRWDRNKLWFFRSWELMHALDEIMGREIYRFEAANPAPRIIDCGANIGLSVLYFLKLYPQSRITAFEPDARNFDLLQKNLRPYNEAQLDLRPKAVWVHNGHISFDSRGGEGSKIADDGGTAVRCTRLADLLREPVDFLKIDIEGAEYAVLKDCAHLLRNVKHLFLEYHGQINHSNELTEMLELLRENGFDYYIREAADNVDYPYLNNRRREGFEQQLNIFAVRADSAVEAVS